MPILISDPDQQWSDKLMNFLSAKSLGPVACANGRDCQLKMFKGKYEAVLIDIDTWGHSGFEVLRYMRLNFPSVKVILTFINKERFNQLNLSREELLKLGVGDIFIKPYSLEALSKSLEGKSQFEAWKKIAESHIISDEQELSAVDEEFTRIKVDSFYSGNTTIFDHYIRIGSNKYIKILQKGDFFDEKRLAKYNKDGALNFLYFKTKDRGIYINFINEILAKAIQLDNGTTEKKVRTLKTISEKYIEEIHTVGLMPELIMEGKAICDNMYNLVQKDRGLYEILRSYEDYDPPAYAHLFLTSFFSVIISKNIEWTSSRTVEMTAMAGLFHDLGKLKLPKEMREMKLKNMTPEQKILYFQHPKFGAVMLQNYPLISEPVKQIVYQHHEWVNGEGFPNRLTGIKIYPLAKITALANEFSDYIITKKVQPLHGLKEFIIDKDTVSHFDSTSLRALVKAFLRDLK